MSVSMYCAPPCTVKRCAWMPWAALGWDAVSWRMDPCVGCRHDACPSLFHHPEYIRLRASKAPGYCLAVCDMEPGEGGPLGQAQ